MRFEIDLEIGKQKLGELGRRRRRRGAAREHLEPRHQLAKGKGFGEIVIAARLQPADAFVDVAERGEDQDRRAVAGGAQLLDHS